MSHLIQFCAMCAAWFTAGFLAALPADAGLGRALLAALGMGG